MSAEIVLCGDEQPHRRHRWETLTTTFACIGVLPRLLPQWSELNDHGIECVCDDCQEAP